MNILAVWILLNTISTTQPKTVHPGDVEHVAEENIQASIFLTLSLCPDIVPHSNLFFTLQLFCSAGWKGGWKLVPTLMPEWGQSPWACCPLESSSAPAPLRAKGGQACVAVWLEAASSTWTSTWFLDGLQSGWKIGWTVRMEELWSAAQSPGVVPQGSMAGPTQLHAFTNDMDNGTKCAPSRLTGVTKQESGQ